MSRSKKIWLNRIWNNSQWELAQKYYVMELTAILEELKENMNIVKMEAIFKIQG